MDITVTDAQLVARPGGPNMWILATEVTEDGLTRRIAHALPEDTLEWRSAEYGIDDPAELLEMVLYEPYLPPEDPLAEPDSLTNAGTVGQAREHHRARIAARRAKGRVRDRNPHLVETRVAGPTVQVVTDVIDRPETPLELLRRELPLDQERVGVRREHVQRMCAELRQRRSAQDGVRGLPSAGGLRRELRLDEATGGHASS